MQALGDTSTYSSFWGLAFILLTEPELHETYGIGYQLLSRSGYTAGDSLGKDGIKTPLASGKNEKNSEKTKDGKIILRPTKKELDLIHDVMADALTAVAANFLRGLYLKQLKEVILYDYRLNDRTRWMCASLEVLRKIIKDNPSEIRIATQDYVTLVNPYNTRKNLPCPFCEFTCTSKPGLFDHFFRVLHPETVDKLRSITGPLICRFCNTQPFSNALELVNHCKTKQDHCSEFGPALVGNLTAEDALGTSDWTRALRDPALPFNWRAWEVVDLLDDAVSDVVDLDED